VSENDVILQTKGLDQLIKALKSNLPKARVGVLGAKAIRTNGNIGSTNASVGAVHEFGLDGMAQRSFLRVPISDMLQKKMEAAGAFDKDVLNEVVKSGSVLPWVKKMAILAEQIVHEAFETGGFGKWPAWKTPGYTNDHGRILEDTGQLRDSITSEVK
jgi:phage gpG-like protein